MYLAIDIGGTYTRLGMFPTPKSKKHSIIKRFETCEEYGKQIETLYQVIEEKIVGTITGVGLSFGGQIARDGQSVSASVNLPDYVNKPLVEDLSSSTKCPVMLAHDCVCGALAERSFGKMRSVDRFAYVTISTGTGAAIYLKKAKTTLISSIEFGHQIITPAGEVCLCGQRGCLETFTGGKQIYMRYGKHPSEIENENFWVDLTEKLAIGLVNLSNLTRIDAAVISGGIALNTPYVRQHLQKCVGEMGFMKSFRVHWSTLGEDAPLLGAMLITQTDPNSILH
jgi:glucokinase